MTTASQIVRVALDYAKLWRAHNCTEQNNQSACFRYLFENNYDKVTGNPWCAATVSAILAESYSELGISNPFRWTLSAWNLYEQAAKMKNMRVDSNPAPGSVFTYPRRGDNSAHTGIVVGVTSTGIYTVEGNSGNALKCYGCPDNAVVVVGNTALRTHRQMQLRGTVYIHTEEVQARSITDSPVQAENSALSASLLALLAVGTWLALK